MQWKEIYNNCNINTKSVGGIAARVTLFSNRNEFSFNTKNNEDLLSYNIRVRRNQIS